MINNEVCI